VVSPLFPTFPSAFPSSPPSPTRSGRARRTRRGRRGINSDLESILAATRAYEEGKQRRLRLERVEEELRLGLAAIQAENESLQIRPDPNATVLEDLQQNIARLGTPDQRAEAVKRLEASAFRNELGNIAFPAVTRGIREQLEQTPAALEQFQAAREEAKPTDLLSRAMRMPVVRETLAGFEVAHRYAFQPAGTLLVSGVQEQFIPGEQELERRMNEALDKARASGEGLIGRLRAFLEAGKDVPLPTINLELPVAIDLPNWMVGDRKLKEIQLGVRGLSELAVSLPVDLVVGKGLGSLTRTALRRGRTSGYVWGKAQPGTPEWMRVWRGNPGSQGQMAEYARRLEAGLPTNNLKNTIVPPPASGGALGQVFKAFEAPPKTKIPFKQKFDNVKTRVKRSLTDSFAGIEEVEGRLRRQWKKTYGHEMPSVLKATAYISVIDGAASAGLQRAQDALSSMSRTLGKGIDPKFVSAYLVTRHGLDIAAIKGGQRVIAGGVRGTAGARSALDEMSELLGPEHYGRVESAARKIVDFYSELRAREVSSGRMSRELADELGAKYPWYNPIAYQEFIDNVALGKSKRVSVTRNDLKRLGDEGLEIARQDPLEIIYRAGVRSEIGINTNNAARSLVHMLLHDPETMLQMKRTAGIRPVAKVEGKPVFRPKQGEIPGTISYMEGGKRIAYQVPEWVELEAKGFAKAGLSNVEQWGRWANAVPRAVLVSYNPAFIVTQGLFDTMTVAAMNGVMPWSVANSLARNLKQIVKGDKQFGEFMRSGADVMGWWGTDTAKLARETAKGGNLIVHSDSTWRNLLGHIKIWDTIREVGHAVELAPRAAVFRKSLERGSPEVIAAQMARRSTVDFARAGNAIRFINSWFLFLNPAVQGSLLPYRAVKQNPRIALAGLSGYMTLQAASYAWNRQFEEYKDIPLHDKYGSLMLMLPSDELDPRTGRPKPHYVKLVSNVRELAAMSAPMMYAFGRLDETAPEDFGQFIDAYVPLLNPLQSITRLPIPTHYGQMAFESITNHDSFRDRPIVPEHLVGLPPDQQFDEFSSELSRRVGGWFNYSPMKIDHLLRNGMMQDIFGMADAIIRAVDEGEDPEVEGIVAFLKELPENYPEEEVKRLRRVVLSSLTPEQRSAVESSERKPEPIIPFVSTILRRFHLRYGGQLYRTSVEQAAGKAGVPVDQIRRLNMLLGEVGDQEFQSQTDLDYAFSIGEISGDQWRGGRSDSGKRFGATLAVGHILMPRASVMFEDPQARAAYYDDIYTLSGNIKDTRFRGELLLASLRAIPVPEIAPGVEDWSAYFSAVDEFEGGLTGSDKTLLRQEQEAGMTPFERDFFRDSRRYAFYWNLHRELLDNDPQRVAAFEQFIGGNLAGEARELALESNPWIRELEKDLVLLRRGYRVQISELDAFLFRFGYTPELVQDDNGNIVHLDIHANRYELAPWRRALERETQVPVGR
jgi:hypothetical protein